MFIRSFAPQHKIVASTAIFSCWGVVKRGERGEKEGGKEKEKKRKREERGRKREGDEDRTYRVGRRRPL